MSDRPSAEKDAHRCATPPEAMPGDEWTCPACGLTYWADDTEETWGEGTFEWRVLPPDAHHPRCSGQHETVMGETACVLSPGRGD